jgi:hypothetical protein
VGEAIVFGPLLEVSRHCQLEPLQDIPVTTFSPEYSLAKNCCRQQTSQPLNLRQIVDAKDREGTAGFRKAKDEITKHPPWACFCAAKVFLQVRGGVAPYCAKLHHANDKRCIFHHAQEEGFIR